MFLILDANSEGKNHWTHARKKQPKNAKIRLKIKPNIMITWNKATKLWDENPTIIRNHEMEVQGKTPQTQLIFDKFKTIQWKTNRYEQFSHTYTKLQ